MAGKSPKKKPPRKKAARKKKARRRTGPKPKLTPEVQERIIGYLKAGAYIETAAAGSGISKDTLHGWLQKGRAEKPFPLYRQFVEAVDVAMAQDELRGAIHMSSLGAKTIVQHFTCEQCTHVNTVKVPVPDRVALEASKWRLERKYPTRYGNRIKLEHSADEETVQAAYDKVHKAAEDKRARDRAEAQRR